MKYPNIEHMLKTVFVSDFSLPEEMAISIYLSSAETSGIKQDLKSELVELYNDDSISWKKLLCNDEYEVLECDTELEAKEFITRVLKDPIM